MYFLTNITGYDKESLARLISKGASGNSLQSGVKVKSKKLGKSKRRYPNILLKAAVPMRVA